MRLWSRPVIDTASVPQDSASSPGHPRRRDRDRTDTDRFRIPSRLLNLLLTMGLCLAYGG